MASRRSATGSSITYYPPSGSRTLRMRATPSCDLDDYEDDLPEHVYKPVPAPPQPRGRGRAWSRRNGRQAPPVVQEPEWEPPAPQEPAVVQQEVHNEVVYLVGCPPDVMVATGDGPGGRTVVGYQARRVSESPGAGGNDADNAGRILCSCHGASFTPAEFLLHAGATDVSYPLRRIRTFPWLGGEVAPSVYGYGRRRR
uniref:Ninja-family protein n=1 Tax=Oryza brachyantha TaxID=4533 RepID=J3L750_ORYBR